MHFCKSISTQTWSIGTKPNLQSENLVCVKYCLQIKIIETKIFTKGPNSFLWMLANSKQKYGLTRSCSVL